MKAVRGKMAGQGYILAREQHDGKQYIVARDVHVELTEGVCCRPSGQIVKECRKYDNDIQFSNGSMAVNGRDIMALLTLEAYHGRNLDVFVEDKEGTNAKEIAARLCSGLTTKAFDPDFEVRE